MAGAVADSMAASNSAVGAIDHLLGQKPVDPAAAAALRTLHDDWHLRLVLASNTLPCESRWPALQKAGLDTLFRAALLSYPLGIRILRTNGGWNDVALRLTWRDKSRMGHVWHCLSCQAEAFVIVLTRGFEIKSGDDLVWRAVELRAVIEHCLL